MKAVIVLSGGLDSTTCMGIAHDRGYQLYPLTFEYQQRHTREIEQAKKITEFYQVANRHRIVPVSFLGQIGKSALTDKDIEVPIEGLQNEIPQTYVPARNLIFLSLATAYAETIGAEKIYLGVSAIDYSGYPDCRPEFIESFNQTVRYATKAGVSDDRGIQVETPLIQLTKAETIRLGLKLQVPYHLTTSCYIGEEKACGVCDSCRLRLRGFAENQMTDPIPYQR